MPGNEGLLRRFGPVLVRAWARRGMLPWLLRPVSALYGTLVFLRRCAFSWGWIATHRVDCAVIVVGNVVAGGAGKTPTTIGIVKHLQTKGWSVGVVSRGYGRTSDDTRAVATQDDVHETGDEPLLIARATGVPVYVGRNRYAAATLLLEQHPQTQVIVCDDGLQHYPLYRDIEVCVMDERGVGNGWLLPSGPLREPWPRVPVMRCGQNNARLLVLHTGGQPVFGAYQAQRSLATIAVTHTGQSVPLGSLNPPVLALAGIAKPEQFFSALRARGVAIDKTLPLPDHFDFSALDLTQLQGFQVICTEKDAVKLWRLYPSALAVPLLQTLEPTFLGALDTTLDGVNRTKLSSRHGHQTT